MGNLIPPLSRNNTSSLPKLRGGFILDPRIKSGDDDYLVW